MMQVKRIFRSHPLIAYILKRTLWIGPTLLIVIFASFLLTSLVPGDPAYIIGGEGITKEYAEFLRSKWGLNKPIWERLYIYVINILQGDFGYSFRYNSPVLNVVTPKIPTTLMLVGTAIALGAILGILLGAISGGNPHSWKDHFIITTSLIVYSQPLFWTGMICVLFFSVYLGLFPTHGMVTARLSLSGLDYVFDVLWHMVLPVTVMTLYLGAEVARLTRASVLEVLRLDFIQTAEAKGLPKRVILFKHVLRNALLPIVTYVGYYFGTIMVGAVLTETVFAWPGMGRLLYEAIRGRDTPVITCIFILTSVMVIITNIVIDIFYRFLDPRIQRG